MVAEASAAREQGSPRKPAHCRASLVLGDACDWAIARIFAEKASQMRSREHPLIRGPLAHAILAHHRPFLVLEVFMARITVEDCLHNVPNLFQLVLVAAKRARKLANGAEPTVEWENDKPTVVALREVAAGHIGPEILEEIERPAPEIMPEMEIPAMSGELRAPHLGLGD